MLVDSDCDALIDCESELLSDILVDSDSDVLVDSDCDALTDCESELLSDVLLEVESSVVSFISSILRKDLIKILTIFELPSVDPSTIIYAKSATSLYSPIYLIQSVGIVVSIYLNIPVIFFV